MRGNQNVYKVEFHNPYRPASEGQVRSGPGRKHSKLYILRSQLCQLKELSILKSSSKCIYIKYAVFFLSYSYNDSDSLAPAGFVPQLRHSCFIHFCASHHSACVCHYTFTPGSIQTTTHNSPPPERHHSQTSLLPCILNSGDL